ncbi:hypothetical protein [Nocardia vaccinii]|uniref:hypothetical protein n=1 Tax=Nocardia vaccinii TaxID=1822 RepID=UPI000AE1DC1E|nr:hypothetical protein [Nocardia vaccinii]
MASIDLFFPLSEVLEIAEHAAGAREHSPSLAQHEEGVPGVASLVWAKHNSIYVRSNGLPRQLADPRVVDGPARVVYAVGWGPGTGPALGRTPVGGDDFAEYIELGEPFPDGGSLIELIRDYAQGDGWLVITAMPGQYAVSFAPPEAFRSP